MKPASKAASGYISVKSAKYLDNFRNRKRGQVNAKNVGFGPALKIMLLLGTCLITRRHANGKDKYFMACQKKLLFFILIVGTRTIFMPPLYSTDNERLLVVDT